MTSPPVDRILALIRAEYRESPGLRLKRPQIERLWGLDPATCETLLNVLLESQFLRRTREGDYVRADTGDEVPLESPTSRRPRPVPRVD
jgi:hypothetical protein